jgi:hypothetical protein
MSRNGSGVYSLPAGSAAVDDAIIDPVAFNTLISDLEADANTARPIVAGGTGATTAAAARTNLGAPPTPQGAGTTTGAGRWTHLYAPENTALVLPDGGTWSWFSLAFNISAGAFTSGGSSGLNAGGTTILSAQANRQGVALAWRIA